MIPEGEVTISLYNESSGGIPFYVLIYLHGTRAEMETRQALVRIYDAQVQQAASTQLISDQLTQMQFTMDTIGFTPELLARIRADRPDLYAILEAVWGQLRLQRIE